MQTVLNPEYKTGIFKQELKNRFLCEVEIDGESTVCYVPSSCHLSNFLDLQGKSVLLVPTQSKNARWLKTHARNMQFMPCHIKEAI